MKVPKRFFDISYIVLFNKAYYSGVYELSSLNKLDRVVKKLMKLEASSDKFSPVMENLSMIKHSIDMIMNKECSRASIKHSFDGGIYEKYIPVISDFEIEEFSEEDLSGIDSEIDKYDEYVSMIPMLKGVSDCFYDIETGNGKSIDDNIDRLKETIRRSYNVVLESSRDESSGTSLDLASMFGSGTEESAESFKKIATDLTSLYKMGRGLSSGLLSVDDIIYGFMPTRFYMILGESKIGKSSFMINLLNVFCDQDIDGIYKNGKMDMDQRPVHLYITLENLAHETLSRFLVSGEFLKIGIRHKNMYEYFNSLKSEDIEIGIRKMMDTKVGIPIIEYRPGLTVDSSDIESIVRKYYSIYGSRLKSLFVDYVDLFSTLGGKGTDDAATRHSFSREIMGLKNISVAYKIPVITVTQVNRTGYSGKSTVTSVSENIKKIEHSDVIMILNDISDKSTPAGFKKVNVSVERSRYSVTGETYCTYDTIKNSWVDGKLGNIPKNVPNSSGNIISGSASMGFSSLDYDEGLIDV